MGGYSVLVLLVLSSAAFSATQQDCFSRDAAAEVRHQIQSCIDGAFQNRSNVSSSPLDLSGYCWVQNPAKKGQYCFSGDQWNAMQDDMYKHIYAKLLKSFNVTREVDQKVQQLQDRIYQQIYSQVMRELNATQEELQQTLDARRQELLRKINTTYDNLQQEYLRLGKHVPATSCKEIVENDPQASSGYYKIWGSNGCAVRVYCDMDRVCGCNGTGGGWTRVAYLNMTDPSQRCPGAWRLITTPRRTCGRATQNLACDSVIFPSNGIQYTHVCGRVIGYHVVSPDAFNYPIRFNPSFTTDNPYLDGVSITHGASGSRQHIWSFAGGLGDPTFPDSYHCPCHGNVNPPSFVGQDYFCETANDARLPWRTVGFEVNDPLWDGQNCSATFSCECTLNNPPWFCKQLPQPTTDNIEARICGSRAISNEDTPVEFMELYIR